MRDLTRAQRRHLRELAGRGYEAALGSELDALHEQFRRWKAGEIDIWALDHDIHEHHNGAARDLYRLFGNNQLVMQVAWCVAYGYLDEADVRPDCMAEIESLVAFYREKDEEGSHEKG